MISTPNYVIILLNPVDKRVILNNLNTLQAVSKILRQPVKYYPVFLKQFILFQIVCRIWSVSDMTVFFSV